MSLLFVFSEAPIRLVDSAIEPMVRPYVRTRPLTAFGPKKRAAPYRHNP